MDNIEKSNWPKGGQKVLIIVGVLLSVIIGSYTPPVFGGFKIGNLFKNEQKTESKDVMVKDDKMMGDMHQDFDIADGSQNIPTITINAFKDAKSGYNVQVVTSNWTFAPQKANIETGSYNEGHAHLTVGGKMISRVYGEWVHIPADLLVKGDNNVEISLNTNTHKELHYLSKAISAQVVIVKD